MAIIRPKKQAIPRHRNVDGAMLERGETEGEGEGEGEGGLGKEKNRE